MQEQGIESVLSSQCRSAIRRVLTPSILGLYIACVVCPRVLHTLITLKGAASLHELMFVSAPSAPRSSSLSLQGAREQEEDLFMPVMLVHMCGPQITCDCPGKLQALLDMSIASDFSSESFADLL